ncbi:formate dehydrogenase accessory sulfurtransferase FdhD [Pseudoteredinibacter isoporae]|uniref:Sulfur carrier protein FdhD n=1 Tax=Pseudoteredinibacter isoporae TaxID=570281 RepID=A0A7X0JPR7_9GAMM|nr:formate dehydrogenase accessory sulfurtransferase FdhD [Pseudoteredinibacter isoporae]MBB6520047.1 FdhD protein [Pseudoteredinibacter isoporae]NHO85619.1 formate dehydrogenase accessory sulfurtransferase FdhD [Pseudoteredinibacter isoporae]NIB25929.1 formate dehydrogenase accessory sulfurtransferase FdhD [Pseudoteredinibacter isoporae]
MDGIEFKPSLLRPLNEVQNEALAQELPVALVYNGISHAVLMASPHQLDELALGFSLSEGIIHQPKEFYSCELRSHARGMEVEIDIASAAMDKLKQRRRFLMGPSGCGLCGLDSLQSIPKPEGIVRQQAAPDMMAIQQAISQLNSFQTIREKTGATHCAAACNADGKMLLLREDVGRHNALDKLIGALAKKNIQPDFVIASSRASYEMVSKTISQGIPTLVCLSAATSLAITTAKECGLNLIGFARPDKYRMYSGFNNE